MKPEMKSGTGTEILWKKGVGNQTRSGGFLPDFEDPACRWKLPDFFGKFPAVFDWIWQEDSEKIRRISVGNTASTKLPNFHGTDRFPPVLFDLGADNFF